MLTIATFLLAAGAQASTAGATPATATVAAVPAEIEQHYREYNFVNSFSTADERHTIAAGVVPSHERLGRVARLMNRLAQRIEEIDPGIFLHSSPRHESEFRSDLVRIASSRVDEAAGEAWVTLDVTTLDRGSNVTLVSKFDDLGAARPTPSLDVLLSAMPAFPRIHTSEIHHWIRVDGTWRREAATLIFLAN